MFGTFSKDPRKATPREQDKNTLDNGYSRFVLNKLKYKPQEDQAVHK